MSVIYILLAISLVVAIIFFVAFIVSVKQGQYEDSYTPSVRMLFEDELVKTGNNEKSEELRVKSSEWVKIECVEQKQKYKSLFSKLFPLCSPFLKNKIQLNKQV